MDPDALDVLDRVAHGGATDPHVLDFSANTNPESPSGAVAVYDAAFAASRRYPADDYSEFRAVAAEYLGCEARQVIPTAGALAGLRLVVDLVVDAGDSVLVPAPSFGEYEQEVRIRGADPAFVPHDELLETDPAPHALAIVCNPNNPTGDAYDPEALRAYARRCRETDTVLVVDEAFLDFTDEPSMATAPGVVVARSLTKVFGLPGLRAGFLVATGKLRDRIDTARLSWSLSTPAAAVGAYCLRQEGFIVSTRDRVAAERDRMRGRLETRFDVRPSDAPFVLFDVGDRSVDDVLETAREAGIVVRDARSFRGLDNHVRVAVRHPEENDRLLAALDV